MQLIHQLEASLRKQQQIMEEKDEVFPLQWTLVLIKRVLVKTGLSAMPTMPITPPYSLWKFYWEITPFSPKSDQLQISPCNIIALLFLLKQSGHENYRHDHTRWICLIFYHLLPTTSVGNGQGQQMRIQILISGFKASWQKNVFPKHYKLWKAVGRPTSF